MPVKIHFAVTNSGDGSNGIQWVRDPAVLQKMEELADNGDECYASGDGLQVKTLVFPDGFDLDDSAGNSISQRLGRLIAIGFRDIDIPTSFSTISGPEWVRF